MRTFDAAALQKQLQQSFSVELNLPNAVQTEYADWRELSCLLAALIDACDAKVIAVSGSQGSGKTTLSEVLSRTCHQLGAATYACSIDDFYLSAADRAALADEVHPLLATRGVPGTHDWKWLREVLERVHAGAADLTLPVFDKGADDRSGTVKVTTARLILEGWCVGVTPQTDAELLAPCNALETREDPDRRWRRYVNEQIRAHYVPLWRHIDLWVHLRVPSFEQVIAWRTLQEQHIAAGQRMSDAALVRFIQHYERLTRWIWACPPQAPGIVVQLDADHRVANVTVLSGDQHSVEQGI